VPLSTASNIPYLPRGPLFRRFLFYTTRFASTSGSGRFSKNPGVAILDFQSPLPPRVDPIFINFVFELFSQIVFYASLPLSIAVLSAVIPPRVRASLEL